MKILVLTCSTGGGHNSCANYIKEEFDDNNIECDVKDYMDIVGDKASEIAEKLYLNSTKGNGSIFKGVYKLGEIYNKTGITSPVYGLNKLVKEKLYNYIKDNNYTLIIGTHLFPCLTLTAIKKEYDIKFINVATDYECIPFWNETSPDVFVIPSKLLKTRFVEKGIDSQVILATGIPVASRFFKIKKEIKVPKNKNIVLLTSGSMGFGDLTTLVNLILKQIDCYLIVVCGTNKEIKRELDKISNDNLLVEGFVNNLNEYIYVSDVVVAKPGGITTTEVAMMRRPLVHTTPIPGVENYNATFFSSNKMSIEATTLEETVIAINNVLNNKDLQEELIENQIKIINDKSAQDLVKYVIDKFKEEK